MAVAGLKQMARQQSTRCGVAFDAAVLSHFTRKWSRTTPIPIDSIKSDLIWIQQGYHNPSPCQICQPTSTGLSFEKKFWRSYIRSENRDWAWLAEEQHRWSPQWPRVEQNTICSTLGAFILLGISAPLGARKSLTYVAKKTGMYRVGGRGKLLGLGIHVGTHFSVHLIVLKDALTHEPEVHSEVVSWSEGERVL